MRKRPYSKTSNKRFSTGNRRTYQFMMDVFTYLGLVPFEIDLTLELTSGSTKHYLDRTKVSAIDRLRQEARSKNQSLIDNLTDRATRLGLKIEELYQVAGREYPFNSSRKSSIVTEFYPDDQNDAGLYKLEDNGVRNTLQVIRRERVGLERVLFYVYNLKTDQIAKILCANTLDVRREIRTKRVKFYPIGKDRIEQHAKELSITLDVYCNDLARCNGFKSIEDCLGKINS